MHCGKNSFGGINVFKPNKINKKRATVQSAHMELAVKTATEGQLVHNIKQKSATKRHMLKSKHPSQQ